MFVLSACKEEKKAILPSGVEEISSDGPAHFILLDEVYWGDRSAQIRIGKLICTKFHIGPKSYCEVYYFANEDDIPEKFPIINRKSGLGYFTIKNGKSKIKTLPIPDEDSANVIFVFFKNIYRKYIIKSNIDKREFFPTE